MKNILQLKNVSKTYASGDLKVKAVNDISLNIRKGEFTAFAGPSGSGKTTLLNLVGGLDHCDQGSVCIEDTILSTLNENDLSLFRLENIGFIFQSYNLIPVLTAVENVEFVLQLQGIPPKIRKQRAIETLVSVGLADRLNNRPNQLSGGQQQRVAIARALVGQPKFILADEPTANLDSNTARELLDLMESLNQNQGVTFLFSTHDPKIIERIQRKISLEDGQIIEDYCSS